MALNSVSIPVAEPQFSLLESKGKEKCVCVCIHTYIIYMVQWFERDWAPKLMQFAYQFSTMLMVVTGWTYIKSRVFGK